jgi:hypothetical protein
MLYVYHGLNSSFSTKDAAQETGVSVDTILHLFGEFNILKASNTAGTTGYNYKVLGVVKKIVGDLLRKGSFTDLANNLDELQYKIAALQTD